MIQINIQKKELWLLTAIMVFLVGVGYVLAYDWTTGSGTGLPSIHGHTADEIEGGGGTSLGTWDSTDSGQVGGAGTALAVDTTYQAATDGFVTAWKNAGGTPRGYTGSSSTLTDADIKVSADFTYNNDNDGITMPVKRGDSWKVTGFQYIYWIPIISGGGSAGSSWKDCEIVTASSSSNCPEGKFLVGMDRASCSTLQGGPGGGACLAKCCSVG